MAQRNRRQPHIRPMLETARSLNIHEHPCARASGRIERLPGRPAYSRRAIAAKSRAPWSRVVARNAQRASPRAAAALGQRFRAPFDGLARPALRDGVEILDIGGCRTPPDDRGLRSTARKPLRGARRLRSRACAAPAGPTTKHRRGPGGPPTGPRGSIRADRELERPRARAASRDRALEFALLPATPEVDLSPSSQGRSRPLAAQPRDPTVGRRWSDETALEPTARTVFDAHYDHCHFWALDVSSPVQHVQISPHYRDASYFRFSRLAQALYLGYEEWALRGKHRNLATHYLVCAER